MAKISVITITFNNHDELMRTVDSLSGVTDLEHIIINGGSSPETIEFLNKRHKGKYISEKDNGIADAINKGIRLVSTPYFMILNSGDLLIEKDYFTSAFETLENRNEVDFIHADIIFDDRFANKILIKPSFCHIGRGMPFNILTAIFRTKSFLKVGFFNTSYRIAMDYDWVVKSQKFNLKSIYFDKFPVVLMDGNGVSSSGEFKGIKECYFSLVSNDEFSFISKCNFTKRVIFYLIRDILQKLKMHKIIMIIKKVKYRAI